MSRVIMKSEKVLEKVIRAESVIESLNEKISDLENSDEENLIKVNERLDHMNSYLKGLKKEYNELLINDGPYYEDGTLNYYTDKFKDLDFTKLESCFVLQVVFCIENDRIKNKLKILKNIVKAYKIRINEIMK